MKTMKLLDCVLLGLFGRKYFVTFEASSGSRCFSRLSFSSFSSGRQLDMIENVVDIAITPQFKQKMDRI